MSSSPPQDVNNILQMEESSTPYSTPSFRPAASRRTSSFSSSSRSDSWDSFFDSSPLIEEFNTPPMTSPIKFKGIPFSWEQTPGIPKNHHGFKKKEPSRRHLLPPPPAKSQEEIFPKKLHQTSRLKKDPFFAALIECSKDDHDHGSRFGFKIGRSLSDRFGFISMYTSCKTSCAVSESLPRTTPHYLRRHRAG